MTPREAISEAFARYHSGDLAGAERLCRQSLTDDANLADGWLLLGVLADHARFPADAEKFLRRAAELAPNDPRIWNTLGTVRDGVNDLDGAREAYHAALQARPDYAPAWHNLGEALRALGCHREAAEHYRKALRSDPNLAPAASSLLFSLHFDPDLTDEQIHEEHRRWGESLASRVPPLPPPENDPDPDRRLTIGYIGPDFRQHAVARFFEPLLAAHDRVRVRPIMYSECPIIDAVGQRLREQGDLFRIIRGQSAEHVAQQIRADGVDILVDLAGHTRDNRLDVLARRPAPIQMTFLGYPFGTGLPRIDYRITDSVLDPPDAPPRRGIGESLLRLPPGVCCFRPPDDAPPVNDLPFARNGFLTFGCHHPLPKLNPPLLKLWAELARRLPTARFLCVRNSWDGAPARELKQRLQNAGLSWDRVELRKPTIAPGDYLRSFHDMDVVLDALPFNSHTMTCESLWMGVPVLTVHGDRPAGRLTSSVLTAMKLEEFIAENLEDFLAKASALGEKQQRLAELRRTLRALLTGTLGNASYYARCVEGLYRESWRTWCRTASSNRAAATTFIPPTWDEIHTRGCAVLEEGHADEAAKLFRQALELNPLAVPPRAMLAGILSDRCDLAAAQEQYALALQAGPEPKLKIAAATVLPPIYDSRDQIAECRAKLIERIDVLHADNVRLDPMRGPIPNLFLIAYQGMNDRDVMASYARLFAPPAWALEPTPRVPRNDGRVRIGLISQYLGNHTIGTLNRGLIEKIDHNRFHVTVLTAAKGLDETATIIRQSADEFIHLPNDTAAAVRLIRGLGLNVALFTDLGMSCVTLALAHARLAPRQAVTWGHPLTTGIPTIDDFLSAKIYESDHAQDHYTERLVTLHGLNTYYFRPVLDRPYTRHEFNLPDNANLYGILQTLFKFHPDMDAILNYIIDADPQARLIVMEGRNPYWKKQLLARWQRTAPKLHDRLHWIKTLPRQQFLGLCSVCDVMLDPLHFGGGNTSLEALALNIPVVTLPSPYLRARLTLGFYQHISLHDLIATNPESYISLAVKLGTDHEWRKDIKEKIATAAPALFEHRASVTAFEEYFQSVV